MEVRTQALKDQKRLRNASQAGFYAQKQPRNERVRASFEAFGAVRDASFHTFYIT